jgi:hypothetical protein
VDSSSIILPQGGDSRLLLERLDTYLLRVLAKWMRSIATEFSENEFVSSKSSSITFDEARTVIGDAFTGTETISGDRFNDFQMEPIPCKNHEDRVFNGLFILGFPIYDNEKQGGWLIPRRTQCGWKACFLCHLERIRSNRETML